MKTRELYNQTASRWSRREPNSLSDFTGRPRVFELCGDVIDKHIVDLGCGEGYCARVLATMGAGKIDGIELSEAMVDLAVRQNKEDSGFAEGLINYRCGDVTDLPYQDHQYDLAVGVFVYNYLTLAQTEASFSEVFRVLKPGGEFVFAVPHPSFPFIRKKHEAPFYFDVQGKGYFSSRDHQSQGKIFCRDGTALDVQMIPKSLGDYFDALANAGFTSLPTLVECGVTDEMLKMDLDFFGPVSDLPLHLAFKLVK